MKTPATLGLYGDCEAEHLLVELQSFPGCPSSVKVICSSGRPLVSRIATIMKGMMKAIVSVLLMMCCIVASNADEIAPGILRTPDERFANLKDFPFKPNYMQVGSYRVHYLDEGPADSAPILLIHGEPTWSYLFRKMIPILTAAGHRVIAPDLVGFGKSDKPEKEADYSYQMQVDVMLDRLALTAAGS